MFLVILLDVKKQIFRRRISAPKLPKLLVSSREYIGQNHLVKANNE